MKKIILIVSVFICSVNSSFSQKWENYFQLGIGTGYLMDANINDTPLLQFEYGKTYKWLDLVLALEYANSKTYNDKYVSLLVKTKFDFVKMFVENTKHSFKLGAGIGIGATDLKSWYNNPENSYLYSISSIMASYEYEITDKTWLGAFFNNYPSDNFFGLHYVGFSIRRNF